MEIIEGIHFENECLRIDNTRFVDCIFVNCILEYAGEDVVFERARMHGCRHVFYGRARRTLQYLQSVGLMHYQPAQWGEFSNQVN